MSELLNELIIRIKAETSKAKKGIEETTKSVDDLGDTAKKTASDFEKSGNSIISVVKKITGGLAAMYSVRQIVDGAIARAANIDTLNQTAEALGVGITELDAFGLAAEKMGGDAQGARDSLTDMAEKMGEALADTESGAAKAFSALGIGLKGVDGQSKNAIEGILDLAGAVEGMGKEEAIFKIKELGITDNRTVEMVLKGRKELERLLQVQKDGGAVTKEQAERAKMLTTSLDGLKKTVSDGANSFFDRLIPAMSVGLEWLTKIVDWAKENENFVTGFFIAIAAVVAAVYLPAMISAGIATLAATWPLILIVAAIAAAAAAFALLYDDIMNFIEGNDSFIGQIFDKYPKVKEIVFAIIDAFKAMGTALVIIFDFIVARWKMLFDSIMGGVGKVVSGVKSVAGFFGFGGGSSVASAGKHVPSASGSSLNAKSSAAISNGAGGGVETNVPIGQVTINTSASTMSGAGKDMGDALKTQLQNLNAQTATGVAR